LKKEQKVVEAPPTANSPWSDKKQWQPQKGKKPVDEDEDNNDQASLPVKRGEAAQPWDR
jgi:hypothetical protein